jgi:hypothetical protein
VFLVSDQNEDCQNRLQCAASYKQAATPALS